MIARSINKLLSRAVALLLAGLLASCTGAGSSSGQPTTTAKATSTSTSTTTNTPTSTTTAASSLPTRPPWLGTRDLTLPDGSIATGLETPPELTDRRFETIDLLPPPTLDDGFVSSVALLQGEVLERSTWDAECPVLPSNLRYLTLTFWGFDDEPHTGDMIVHANVAEDVLEVFNVLYDARYPIEELRVITDADLNAPASGDGNVTTAFVCRAVRWDTEFSEHAYGLAIDINPFLNPYSYDEYVIPELARHYLPRDLGAPGQIVAGDVVTTAFESIGWGWGGEWFWLVDYQHFALHDR